MDLGNFSLDGVAGGGGGVVIGGKTNMKQNRLEIISDSVLSVSRKCSKMHICNNVSLQ